MTTEFASQLFTLLSDHSRLTIVRDLRKHQELCACVLLRDLKITQPTLSHHMKLLVKSGLVWARKDGRWVHYSLNNELYNELFDFIR